MRSKIVVDTRGIDALIVNAAGEIDQTLGEMAADMVADMMQSFSRQSPSAPGEPPGVVTGRLKNSLRFKREGQRLWVVSAGTDYAPHLEYGTRRMAARPFMRPAAWRAGKRIGQAVARALKRARS